MKTLRVVSAAFTLAMFASANAFASQIVLSDDDGPGGFLDPPGASQTPSNPSEADIIAQINASDHAEYQAVTDLGVQLYKNNVGTGEEGNPPFLLVNSYHVEVGGSESSSFGTMGTLVYDGGPIVDPNSPAWLVVKDGASGFVVYDLTNTGPHGAGWDGVMDVKFTNAGLINLNNGQLRDISHIEIYGGTAPPPPPGPGPNPIPEPTSLVLLGIGGLGLIGTRLRRRKMSEA